MNAVEIREKLVDTLNLDLIGPERDSPHLAEVLPQAPSRWYLTGFLVPFDASEDQKTDAAGDEGVDEQGESSGSDDSVTPDSAAARRAFFPSSIGISILVPKETKELKVVVRWGDYKPVGIEVPEDPAQTDPISLAGRVQESNWQRIERLKTCWRRSAWRTR